MKLTLNLDDAWSEILTGAARTAKMSVNEYLRQMIAHDAGVNAEADRTDVVLPDISKSWGKRRVTDVTEHTELMPKELPSTVTIERDGQKTEHEVKIEPKRISASDALRATLTKGKRSDDVDF
jgi:hypothetical protein